MRPFRLSIPAGAAVLLTLAAAGCGAGRVRYQPNEPLFPDPGGVVSLAVAPVVDARPDWQKVNADGAATSDLNCRDVLTRAVARALIEDFAASNAFASVAMHGTPEAAAADLLIECEIQHLHGKFQQRWLTPAAFPWLFVLAPFYVPYEDATFDLGLSFKATDVRSGKVVWERTRRRRWTYGPMTAWEFLGDKRFLYGRISDALRAEVGAAILDLAVNRSLPREGAVAQRLE